MYQATYFTTEMIPNPSHLLRIDEVELPRGENTFVNFENGYKAFASYENLAELLRVFDLEHLNQSLIEKSIQENGFYIHCSGYSGLL